MNNSFTNFDNNNNNNNNNNNYINNRRICRYQNTFAGRSTWSDDLGFDLNADFNTNSYINNESFMPFSPGLTVLKQEPQTEHLKISKTSLNTLQNSVGINGSKNEKITNQQESSSSSAITTTAIQKHKTDHCVCSSPQNNTNTNGQLAEENVNQDKTNNILDPGRLSTGIPHQLLTIVGSSKIEQNAASTGNTAANTATTNHGATTADTTTNSSVNTDDYKFQYILAAATSIATKNNEDTLTYLNQGQSYEIKLKKIGDLSFYRDKILKSVIKICFHERRLQFMEREQMQQWQASRPGERIIEVDVPLSYGLCHVNQSLNPNYLNTVEIFWDPMKEVGVYIKVNCISTEFTPKKHGGEKGVPFRLQIETYIENTNTNTTIGPKTPPTPAPLSPLPMAAGQSPTQVGNITPTSNGLQTLANALNIGGGANGGSGAIKQPIHAAACQIKVFKLKGADRKHKQDREKIQKRPQSEQEKFQPSYECTIMNDIALEILTPNAVNAAAAAAAAAAVAGTTGNGCFSPEYMKIWPNSPVHMPKYDGILPYTGASPNPNNNSPIAINSVSSTNSSNLKLMDTNMVISQPMIADMEDYSNNINIMPESSPAQVIQWLTDHRLSAYLSTFAHFSGADIMRMSKDDLIQICGLADGIRMYNVLRAKTISPRLTIYVSLDGNSYNAIYLITNTAKELLQKLFKLPGFYDIVTAKSTTTMNGNGLLETNAGSFNTWNMHSKYSGSGSNIFNDVNNKTFIYISGPSGVHVAVTDEVLNNEIKDGSLYGLEVQNGKVLMKLIINNEK
ncbi:upstream-binding protein 1 isoform X3 [Glossina fuscipes]|uniref:Upstream-binding protein 1 isoform X3 n=1 Tax=Glossina fuscipes TaxID=7396 RepID=A0A9C5ZB19_9MUSC|nr:upstream-binding protein 1 isoform X3 [Glossina fuscipes]